MAAPPRPLRSLVTERVGELRRQVRGHRPIRPFAHDEQLVVHVLENKRPLARGRLSGANGDKSSIVKITLRCKLLKIKVYFAWLGGRDSEPLARREAHRGASRERAEQSTTELKAKELAGRQGFELGARPVSKVVMARNFWF
jgi:hypothetical protein